MKKDSIVILGLEGSGKTVLTSILVDKLNKRSDCPRIRIGSLTAARYIDVMMKQINQGKWPGSTITGNFENLDFEFQVDEKKSITMSLFDLAGQDIREIFCGDEIEERLIPIKNQINDSRHILYTIDILSIIRSYHSGENIREKLFLTMNILKNLPSRKVLLIFTKIKDEDLKTRIESLKEAFPDLYLLLQAKKFKCCAIRCLDEIPVFNGGHIATQPVLDDYGNKNIEFLMNYLTDGKFGLEGVYNDVKEVLYRVSEATSNYARQVSIKTKAAAVKATDQCFDKISESSKAVAKWTIQKIKSL